MLAYSVDADTIFADPSEIESPDEVAPAGLRRARRVRRRASARRWRRTLRRKAQFAYLARKVSPDEARRVKALELKGIAFIKESRRYYPKKELAAHVLGYVGLDNVGLGGLESTYDAQIRGTRRQDPGPDRRAAHALISRVERPADRRRRRSS